MREKGGKNMPDKDRAVAITIDKSLIQEETEEEIKTRVPGTFSDNIRFLWIKKDNCEEINNAKTILTSLNENSTYMLYDRFGNIAENISGKQLYEAHYDPVSEKNISDKDRVTLVQDMNTLGYEFVQVEGYSDDFLMWKSKGEVDTKNAFGFDGWEAVREFVNNVHTLMNNYTVQVLQDRINKDYSVIDYGSFDDREIQTAIKNYSQQKAKNNDITYTKAQTEYDKSEPDNSINIENPILASFYDKYNQKIAKFEDKNTNLNAKINKLNHKITKATEFVEVISPLEQVIPKPIFTVLNLISQEKQEKIANMQSKLSKHESRIADNNKKIHKYESKITLCKKINTFLTNMKTQDGRKENFINGVQEFRSIAIRNASEKFDVTQEKLNKAMSEYGRTHFASEKLKLQKQINNLANKKDKLRDKLIALDALVDKFDTINKMSEQKIENVIEQSCDNIVSDLTGKKAVKAETVVNACSKAIDSASLAKEKDNYLKNAEMSVEDDYDSIDGIINNGNKQQEYDKLKESESEKKSERRTAPLSRNQIKQNANTIAHNEQQTKDKNKTQGQEL